MTRTTMRRARLRALAPFGVLLLTVTGLTIAAAASPRVTVALAASARAVFRGQLWRLLTSGLVAERPIAASIVSFALLSGVALLLCGARTFWPAAMAGNVGSALVAYLLIAVSRLADPGAFAAEWRARDYGVSATSAAWLGAIAATGWRSRRSFAARATIAVSCVAIGAFAYRLHPGITVLASEHVTAFAIGAVVASLARAEAHARLSLAGGRRVLPRLFAALAPSRAAIRRYDPVAVAAVLTTAVLMAGSILPSALASLREELLLERNQTVQCARGTVAIANAPTLVTCQTSRDSAGWRTGPSAQRRPGTFRVVP
jgi:hypothetical protein